MSKEEEIKNGAVEYTKPEPDKTIEQELYAALKLQHDQACGNFKAKSCGHQFDCICPSEKTIAALKRYEDNLNSK